MPEDEPRFVVNRNAGVDTLHRFPAFEECNLDDAEGLEKIDEITAGAMLTLGHAVACEHCKPEPVG
jgi:hypothetical protein